MVFQIIFLLKFATKLQEISNYGRQSLENQNIDIFLHFPFVYLLNRTNLDINALLWTEQASSLSQPQPPKNTHIRATLSFLARLHSHKTALSFLSYAQLGTRSREFPIFSVAPFASGCTRISKRYLQQIFNVTYSGCFSFTTYNFN